MKSKYYLIILFFIIVFGAFLRFYHVPDLFPFAMDEEHQTTMAMTIVKNFHLIWIGVSAANLDFYLGPFWVYFTSFWLFLSKGDPIIEGYVASSIGVLTIAVVFYVGYKMFNSKTGLLASFLYATLPLIVFYDRKYMNITTIHLLSLIMLFSLYQTKKSNWWWVVFAAAFGFVFHVHLSLIFYGLVGIYWFIRYRQNVKKTTVINCVLIFIIVISPLIAFDYFHKWSNITVPLRLIKLTEQKPFVDNFKVHFEYFYQALGRIWYLNPHTVISEEIPFDCRLIHVNDPTVDSVYLTTNRTRGVALLSFLSLSLFVWFLIRRVTWKQANYKLLALSMLSILIPFLIFQGGAFEYYLLGFFPLFLFLPGILFSSIRSGKRYLLLAVFLVFSVVGLSRIFNVDASYSFKTKKELIKMVMNVVKDEPFSLEEEGVCHKYDGWRYLFLSYGRKPERSSTDSALGWLYPDEISKKAIKYDVVMSESRVPLKRDTTKAIRLENGGFSAYIFKTF